MAREFDTELKFGVTDNASTRIRSISEEMKRMTQARASLGVKGERDIQREINKSIAAYNRLERGGMVSATELSRAHEAMQKRVSALNREMEQESVKARSGFERMAAAREAIGIRSEQRIQREISHTQAAYNRLERSGKLSATELSRAYAETQKRISALRDEMERESGKTRNDFQKMSGARETLGIRSEQNIRREISQTIAAYNRLERSGQLSGSELARAFEQAQGKISGLRKELGLTERSLSGMMKGAGRGFMTAGGALWAGAEVLKKPVEQQMDYSQHLAKLANFAYTDRDVQGRIEGKKHLDSVIRNSTRMGGTPEQAANAYEILLRSGVFKSNADVDNALPDVMKISAATEAAPENVATLEKNAYNFGLSKEDTPIAMSAITSQAQHGSVDFSILAQEMPRALENAKLAGFRGRRGFASVGAAFEAAAVGSGDSAEAATDTNDLFVELMSKNLANNAKRIKIKGKGVDIAALERQDALQGKSPIYTLNHLVDTMLKYDKPYQGLRKQLQRTTDPIKREHIEEAMDQSEGQAIARILPNQQSGNALRLIRRNWAYFEKMTSEGEAQFSLPDGKRAVDLDYGVQTQENAFKVNQAKNAQFYASNDAMQPVSKILGDIAEGGAKLATEFPNLAAAASGAETAIKAMTVAATVFSGLSVLADLKKLRGGGVLAEAGSVAESGAGAAAEGAAGAAGGTVLAGGKKLLDRAGSYLLRGGKRALKYGGDLVTEGAMDMGLINPVSVGLIAMTPSDTVGNSEEMNELARLKQRNQKTNAATPGSLEALNRLQNWQHTQPGGTDQHKSVAPVAAPAAPKVSVTVLLDSSQIAAQVQTRIERDARRQ
ncbi:hypothetical protein M942_04475 [Enterobacter ludwigii]|uniref:phage tail tape measure protein n=1 Tax=Enterobacter ludwigii TaxID=299767 RepID=UPI0003D93A03|nr:phage tail tape measure protein [Enterobacter ludwigii]AHE72550.1 hypothetical protein M942_04475 [Enterobacter ludwigii]